MTDSARADARAAWESAIAEARDTLADAFVDQTCRMAVARAWIHTLVQEKGALHKRVARQQEQIRELMQVTDDGE